MKDIIGLLINYKHEVKVVVTVGFMYWVFISLVGAVPKPCEDAAPWRKWTFAFFNVFAGNLSRAAAAFGHTVLSVIKVIRGGKDED